jgi:hypothetical protein
MRRRPDTIGAADDHSSRADLNHINTFLPRPSTSRGDRPRPPEPARQCCTSTLSTQYVPKLLTVHYDSTVHDRKQVCVPSLHRSVFATNSIGALYDVTSFQLSKIAKTETFLFGKDAEVT